MGVVEKCKRSLLILISKAVGLLKRGVEVALASMQDEIYNTLFKKDC